MYKRFKQFSVFIIFALLVSFAPQLSPVSAQAAFADPAFQTIWERTDAVVASGAAKRSWFWGPEPGTTTSEPYAEGQGGVRKVQYFDKSRMEINDPGADKNSQFYVTNGLLTVELVRGRIQVGNSTFQQSVPANIPVAGDTNDANAPTYASFGPALALPKQNLIGQRLNQVISRDGSITNDARFNSIAGTEIAYYDAQTGRNIPTVFWNFVNASGPIQVNGQVANGKLSDPWFFATGLPIAEAYWANVKIDGQATDVLIQPFERRVLTYVPTFAPEWQVQMGNIGRHYYNWRYNGEGRTGGTVVTPVTTPGAGSTPVASPTSVPATPTQVACTTPASVSSTVEPACGPAGTTFLFNIFGFTPDESLSYWFTTPDGDVIGTPYPIDFQGHPGSLELPLETDSSFFEGVWALTFVGETSQHMSVSYFEILPEQATQPPVGATPTTGPTDTSVPDSKDAIVTPKSGKGGTSFRVEIYGFQPNESMSYWLTDPTQAVYGAEQRFQADGDGRAILTFNSPRDLPVGVWATTFHGISSGHESIAYFRILP